MLGTPPPE